jgi:hypothetical protein
MPESPKDVLQRRFKERFHDIHYECLGSIYNLILYDCPDINHRVKKLSTSRSRNPEPKLNVSYDDPSFRNLRNAWYHELCMHRSSVQAAAWKIIQTYYAVFCSISSMTRCIDSSMADPGHKKMHRAYNRQFVTCPKRQNLLLLPTNIILKVDSTGSSIVGTNLRYDVPNVQRGLEWASTRPKLKGLTEISIPLYLMALREWANYEDAYLLFMLYGPYVRDKLERSLNAITSIYLLEAEYFMIEFHGWEKMHSHFEIFKEQMNSNLGEKLPSLEERFTTYAKFFKP